MNIDKSIRLDRKDYIATETAKDLIVLHHTVGGTAQSTIDYWKSDPARVATAYVVERNGVVYEVFDPKCWAFHLGLKESGGAVDKRSIGIEIAGEGGLTQRDGKLYCFDRVSDRTLFKGDSYDNQTAWRGYRFFSAYTDAQVGAVTELVNQLATQFKIPRQTPANHLDTDDAYRKFQGVIAHFHVRADKSDVHPGFPWQKLVDGCSLTLV